MSFRGSLGEVGVCGEGGGIAEVVSLCLYVCMYCILIIKKMLV